MNTNTIFKLTPLMKATRDNDCFTVNKILTRRNNDYGVNEKDDAGYTALRYAIWSNNEQIINLLLDHGAQLNDSVQDFEPILLYCIRKKYYGVVKLLIQKNVIHNINVLNVKKQNALMLSLINKNFELYDLLVEYGCNCNQTDIDGFDVSTYYVEN